MPLCPQITNTPVTVTQTADFTVSSVLPVVPATTTQLDEVGENAEHPLAELLSILGGIILIHERVEEGMQMAKVM